MRVTVSRILELLHRRKWVTAKIAALVFFGMWLLQSVGVFRSAELFIYDHLLQRRPLAQSEDPSIVIIEVTESDIHKYDFPLPDELLAKMLEQIAAQGPRAIGVDIYRDLPVPRNGSGMPALERVLAANPNIIWTFKFGGKNSDGVAPPTFLQNAPDRIGFNDYPIDDKVIRRGLLYLDDGQNSFESFPLRLAELYLGAEQQPISPEPDPKNPQLMRLGRTTFRRVTPTSGGYVGADAAGYQFFLDFAGPRKFTSYSLQKFLTGEVPADFARDRVVLIGSTAESLKDVMTTPLRFGEHGVTLHAQTINQLLRAALTGDLAVRTWSDYLEIAWL